MRYDTGFRPSVHGYPFSNTWRDALLGVFASRGRCGGMVFGAVDRFLAGESESTCGPGDPGEQPAYRSATARRIWRRQIDSLLIGLGVNMRRFVVHTLVAGRVPLRIGIAARSEARSLIALLAEGRPAPLGLIARTGLAAVFRNHQVLAYAVEADELRMVLRIYDPNFPRRDDITLEVSLLEPGPLVQRIGTRRAIEWRSAFLERYARA